jgi:hypothetical protein
MGGICEVLFAFVSHGLVSSAAHRSQPHGSDHHDHG